MSTQDQEQEVLLETIMGLIMHSGDAKSDALEAISAAKTGDFETAEDKIAAAGEAIEEARKIQSNLLTHEASGDKVDISLLLTHGQDHLMNAITFKDLAIEVIEVYKRLEK